MKSGQMKSLGWSRFSASMDRIHGLERPRRIRMAGKLGWDIRADL
jgi:hypothetical protein